MSYRILMGESALVAGWIAAQLPGAPRLCGAVAFGAMRAGMLVGGIAFSEYRKPDVKVTVAGYGNWLSRRLLRTGFAYAFDDLGCRRITALVRADNAASRRLVRKLGFQLEGVHRQATADGGALISYGLLKADCRWLPDAGPAAPLKPDILERADAIPGQ